MAKKIPDRTEHEHQVAVFKWIREIGVLRWPELELTAGSAFGVRLRIGQAMKLKAAGCLKKGWPDIFIAVPKICGEMNAPDVKFYHGMFVELKPLTRGIKKPRREGPGKDQRRMLKLLADQGYYAVCCFSTNAAIREITAYMEGRV
jgi:hypothetical protein